MAKATDNTRPVHIVDSSGTIIDSFGGSGGTSALDDADFTAGANSGTPIMGVYESSPSSVTDGDLGIAGITQTRALRVSVDNSGDIGGGTQYTEDDAAPTNPVGTAIVAQRDDALGGLTPVEGDWTHLYADANGALWVNPGTVPVTGTFWQATQPVSGTVTANAGTGPFPVSDNSGSLTVDAPVGTPVFVRLSDGSSAIATLPVSLASVPSHAVTNAGTFAVQAAQSGTWNVGTVTAVTAISNALPAGTNAIGKLAANSGVDIGDVDVTSIAAGSNLIGNVGIGVRTSGGATPFYNLDVDETEDAIKASAGQLYELYLFNTTAAPLFVKLYNATTANVTVGSTAPLITIPVPGNADSDGAGVVRTWPMGLAFGTAITIACTTAAADADTGAPGTGALIASGAYN